MSGFDFGGKDDERDERRRDEPDVFGEPDDFSAFADDDDTTMPPEPARRPREDAFDVAGFDDEDDADRTVVPPASGRRGAPVRAVARQRDHDSGDEDDDPRDFGGGDGGGAELPPRRPGGALAFGVLAALGVTGLTGIGISMHYEPSTELAHASLRALEQDQTYGVLLRTLHWLGASASIGLLIVVLLGALLRGAYRRRATFAWWSGLLVFLVAIGLGVTGELLPWTQQAVAATEVRTGIVGMAPELGEPLRRVALGGLEIAQPTLTRFHALHVAILPLMLLGALWLHVRARRHMHGRPTPGVTFAQGLVGIVVAAAIGYGAWQHFRAPLGEVYVAGDVGYQAWPEWHFLWLNYLLHEFPAYDRIAAIWLPAGLLGVLLLLPLLDRSRVRRFAHPLVWIPAILVFGGMVTVSVIHARQRPVNEPTMPYSLEWSSTERLGYRLLRQQDCLECHQYSHGGIDYGKQDHDAPKLEEMDPALSLADYAKIIADPATELQTDDMPAFDFLSEEERRALGAVLQRLGRGD
ncbi:MAG: cytochrome b N-terminal domain-containing protein [Planctomycetes bacterium]|nr:cytochrome b N-terminal domain-containing protein [Planctomycetota bacterium]